MKIQFKDSKELKKDLTHQIHIAISSDNKYGS